MTTKTIQARHVTTHDKVVTGGQENTLQPGGKRQALKVAEVQRADGKVALTCSAPGGWQRFSVPEKTNVRVTT